MSPKQQYQQDLSDQKIQLDASQAKAVEALQRVYAESVERKSRFKKKKSVQGLYLWGSVGRGKTYLMDLFYHCLPFPQKQRSHFHQFMREVHNKLREYEGQRDPLRKVARELADNISVLCFDELVVIDIADAMILGQLFTELLNAGVCIVATSNFAPDQLYEDGLQRDRFLPAIEVLKQNMQVIHVDGVQDYREQHKTLTQRYYSPLNSENALLLQAHFNQVKQSSTLGQVLTVNRHQLPVIAYAEGVVWIEFAVLCEGAYSQNDYLDLAQQFHTILLSNVQQMQDDSDDVARRFINLIDVLYDNHTMLVISAAVPMSQLYVGTRLQFEFKRTLSRLHEMQQADYR